MDASFYFQQIVADGSATNMLELLLFSLILIPCYSNGNSKWKPLFAVTTLLLMVAPPICSNSLWVTSTVSCSWWIFMGWNLLPMMSFNFQRFTIMFTVRIFQNLMDTTSDVCTQAGLNPNEICAQAGNWTLANMFAVYCLTIELVLDHGMVSNRTKWT